MARLTIDDTVVQAAEGATILEAADAAGIYIPRICFHPDLPAVDPARLEPWEEVCQGSTRRRRQAAAGGGGYDGCRLCLVALEGEAEPVRACVTPAREGTSVTTSSPEIDALRRARMKEIFAAHPHACVQCAQRAGCALEPCSTNVAKEERCCPVFHVCELRKVAERVGIPDDTPRYHPADLPVVRDEPLFLRDHNLCIGCLRCVRICRDVRHVDALGFVPGDDGRPVVGTRSPTLSESGCRFCLSCVEVCPTGALRLKFEDPRRDGDRVSSCLAACPAGMDVSRYLREIRRGEFARAEAIIREAAPLPRVLGQVCFHPCEEQCLRSDLSEPIAICSLKRAAVEHAGGALWKSRATPHPATGRKVAIVGAGPAGLTAAWFLRLKGHDVTLFEARRSPGGWLRYGIPRYRLAIEALERDIEEIVGIGVDLRTGVEVGRDVTFESLREEHDTVLVAVGARKGKHLPCAGADLPGVENGLDLLERLASGDGPPDRLLAGERVVVVGGGNVAIDVARTALRLGPAEVHLYCLEKREEMPAHGWEIVEAESEGVVLHPGWGPALIAGEGKVERVDFRKCVAVFDDAGKFAPKYDDEVTTSQDASRVLVAIGQEPDLGFLDGAGGITQAGAGHAAVTGGGVQGALEGVFAGGEVVSGPASVIEAIAQGRMAASGIDRHLGGDGEIGVRLLDDTKPDVDLGRIEGFAGLGRVPVPRLRPEEAIRCFSLVEAGYEPEGAVREAERCLRCDLRLDLLPSILPPEPWLAFTEENVASAPEVAGVYQLLDEARDCYAIKGVENLRAALSDLVTGSTKAKFFLFDEDPMYSKRESELIQEYLRVHGRMPPGEGEDELDDLF